MLSISIIIVAAAAFIVGYIASRILCRRHKLRERTKQALRAATRYRGAYRE